MTAALLPTTFPPLISDIQWTLAGDSGNVTFNAVDVNSVVWLMTSSTGWYDGPGVNLNQNAFPRYDGSYHADSYRAPRVITLNGSVLAPNKPANQTAMLQYLGLYGHGTIKTLTVVDGALQLWVGGELSGQPKVTPHANGIGFDYQLTLSCPDPRKYGLTQTTSTGLPATSQYGLDWTGGGAGGLDWTGGGAGGLDWQTVAGSAGAVTVTNSGTAEAWPTFIISGNVSNPSITDSNGNLLQYSGVLQATDILTIASSPYGAPTNPYGQRNVLLDGNAYVRSNLVSAQWAAIPPASSLTYHFSGTALSGSPTLTVSVAPAYW